VRHNHILISALAAVLLAAISWVVVHADIPTPAQITAYFTVNGQPFDAPVNFEISCWGYRSDPGEREKEPGSYTPEVVYTYEASCPAYGCRLEHDLYFNYIHIDACDMRGVAGGQPFLVEHYADFPFECADFMQQPVACEVHLDLPVSAVAALSPIPSVSAAPPAHATPATPATSPARAVQTYEQRFLIALLLTWLIEIPILFVLARYVFKVRQVSIWRILGSGLLASALTLPYLWFLLPSILTTASGIYLGEVLVFLVEALLYHWLLSLSYPKALVLSFTVNTLSFLLGLFLL
jgi:hypothetical protein